MKTMKEREIKGIYALVTGVFLIFLLVPILLLLGKSFEYQGGIALSHYADVLTGKGFAGVFARSAAVASLSAVVTTVLAFILSYTIHYTNVPGGLKGFIRLAAVIPHAASHHHIWIRHHLFLWETGASDQAAGTAAL